MSLNFDTNIQFMKGVGEARAKQLLKLGITNVHELLYHFPRGYEFRGNVKPLAAAKHGEVASFILTAATDVKNATLKRGMTLSKLRAIDESASCEVTFFNQPYIKDSIVKGGEYRFFGKLLSEGGKRLLSSPSVEPVIEGRELPPLMPLYPLTSGISHKMLSKLIMAALSELGDNIPEPLPEAVREKYCLCSIGTALRAIHMPSDFEQLERAKRRLIFEEFYLFSLGTSKTRVKNKTAPEFTDTDITPLTALLPFSLTGAQSRSIGEIGADMKSGIPMRRLMSGDVGSGKTAVAAAAAYIAAKNGHQAAIMAPTEILAKQHYSELSELFGNLGFSCELLTGSVKGKVRKELLARLKSGEISVLVGTHALISEDVEFKNLALAICDEQHRFGVSQRDALVMKGGGDSCHSLNMSATPIPRTLAMFLYGDLDMSKLDELPPGRQRVQTFVVDESYRDWLNGFIRKQKAEGHQTYIVCPRVEETESGEVTQDDIRLFDFGYDINEILSPKNQAKSVTAWHKAMEEALPDLNIGCVHGKMSAAEKDKIMDSFASGELDVLISTTVIEVGVNVPRATLMVVENADRFGLSQLHQLRGRVGRGKDKSYCILVSDAKGDAGARLEVMRTTYDGYKIAEFDLDERGPGDFFKGDHGDVRQHGDLKFRLADLCEDMELLEGAIAAARESAEAG